MSSSRDVRDFVERLELVDGSALELEPWQLEVLEQISGTDRGELVELVELGGRRHGRQRSLARAAAACALLGLDARIICKDDADVADAGERVNRELHAIAEDLGLDLRPRRRDSRNEQESNGRDVSTGTPNLRTMR